MIVWRIREKIIRTVLCCAVYDSCAQRHTHTYEQFLKTSVGLGLVFYAFVYHIQDHVSEQKDTAQQCLMLF